MANGKNEARVRCPPPTCSQPRSTMPRFRMVASHGCLPHRDGPGPDVRDAVPAVAVATTTFPQPKARRLPAGPLAHCQPSGAIPQPTPCRDKGIEETKLPGRNTPARAPGPAGQGRPGCPERNRARRPAARFGKALTLHARRSSAFPPTTGATGTRGCMRGSGYLRGRWPASSRSGVDQSGGGTGVQQTTRQQGDAVRSYGCPRGRGPGRDPRTVPLEPVVPQLRQTGVH